MTLPVFLAPEAEADYDEAFDWFENRKPGDGVEFVTRVQEVFDRIATNPFMHQKVYEEVRRAVVRGYKYVVLYIPEPDRVAVISVFHTSRDPSIWQRRV